MAPKSTLKIGALKMAVQPRARSTMAVALPYARLRYLTSVAGDESAPHFAPEDAPRRDGRAYTSKEGLPLYRPDLRVARRAGDIPGPDVRLLKDAEGKVWLQFVLEEAPPAGMPEKAEPFNVKLESVTLAWKNPQGQAQARTFPEPTLVASENAQDPAAPNFEVRIAAELQSHEVESIHQALSIPSSGAALRVEFSFGYWTDDPAPPDEGGAGGGGGGGAGSGGAGGGGSGGGGSRTRPRVRDHRRRALAHFSDAAAAAVTPASVRLNLSHFAAIRGIERIRHVVEADRGRRSKPSFHTEKLERVVPFTFDPQAEANRRIYAAIRGDTALGERWTDSGFGMIRRAGFPNTVYRLPDEIRLAFHPEMQAPYVIPNLYRTDEDEVRVRVSLGALPWHNPEQVVRLRDFLRISTGGQLASPSVVTGGYEEAKLRLRSAFPEEIRVLDGEEPVISLENGFQLTLDLSLEFYRFLAELLTRENSPGLTGEVTVRLESRAPESEGAHPAVLERRVPVRLTFDDLAGLPLEVRVPEDAISPETMEITNLVPAEVEVGGCMTRLLQYDANSVAPLEVYEALLESGSFPARIAGQGSLSVRLQPKDEREDLWWNAVQVELTTLNLVETPKRALERIHELVPAAALAWNIAVECPVFRQPEMPEPLRSLFRLKVKIVRPGFASENVVLGKEEPIAQVKLQRNLSEVLGEDATGLATYRYQVQNVYFDHEGKWSEERDGEGTALFVFPNPPEGD